MEKDILGEVIEVEKEIQKSIEQEKLKSQERLEKVRKECEEEIKNEELRMRENLGKAVEIAAGEAEQRASMILKNARAEAERFGKLHNEVLTEIIMKQLYSILPG